MFGKICCFENRPLQPAGGRAHLCVGRHVRRDAGGVRDLLQGLIRVGHSVSPQDLPKRHGHLIKVVISGRTTDRLKSDRNPKLT